ncbi:MAG: hypothetical protein KBD78_13145 [Oligoflexales bacterium]|nr:hypothetical protein [Oligoflexales bacterium]
MTTKELRKKTRFIPDPNTLAVASVNSQYNVGLVVNESHSGCRVAFLSLVPLQKGDVCEISVGKLSPIRAEVVWRTEAGTTLCELGFNYKEFA